MVAAVVIFSTTFLAVDLTCRLDIILLEVEIAFKLEVVTVGDSRAHFELRKLYGSWSVWHAIHILDQHCSLKLGRCDVATAFLEISSNSCLQKVLSTTIRCLSLIKFNVQHSTNVARSSF